MKKGKQKEKKPLSRKQKILLSILGIFIVTFCVCVGFLIYCGIMTSYTAYTDDGTFAALPSSYKTAAARQGTVVKIEYTTSTYYSVEPYENHNVPEGSFVQYSEREDEILTKSIYVYLPYGYDETDEDIRYNVLYHIHGTWCDGTTLIKGEGKESETKNVLDNLIANGDMEPVIVVFPTWYNGLDTDDDPDYLISHFETELRQDIMPLVERTFHTYAVVTDGMSDAEVAQAIKDSREHRAISGYSRGSTLTWYVFANMMDEFKWYIPMSGDYLCEFNAATKESCEKKVAELSAMLKEKGYGEDDFFVYSAVGALDFAYYGVTMQFNAMLDADEIFDYGADSTRGNFYLCTAPKVWHGDTMCPMYFYNALQVIFR